MNRCATIDPLEVAKFASLSQEWWEPNGSLKTLHDINPVRLAFIKQWHTLSGATILDVGCGGGILAESMAKAGGLVYGLDVDESLIEVAKIHALNQQLSIQYVCEPIEAFHHNGIEIITCMEMLEHVPDPTLVIEQCARLLDSGGYLFLSTINRTPKAYATAIVAAEYLLGILPKQTHDYKKFIRPSELAAMVRASGFDTLGLTGVAYDPFCRKASLQQEVSVNYLMACRKI